MKIKIVTAYHKKALLLKTDIITPIHVGRAVMATPSKDGNLKDSDRDWLLENLIGDDTGDNISEKNRNYSELTAIYFAWKNQEKLDNPDYIGLMHYRRQFCFDEVLFKKILSEHGNKLKDISPLNFIQSFKDFTKEEIDCLFDGSKIESSVCDADIVAPYIRSDLSQYDKFSVRSDLFKKTDIDEAIKASDLIYPEYKKALNKALTTNDNYLFNMFIMKRELFNECCGYVFDVLFELEKRISLSYRNSNQLRVFGYISEILIAAFIEKAKADGRIVKHLPLIYETELSEGMDYLSKFKDSDIPDCINNACKKVFNIISGVKERNSDRSLGDIHIYAAGELCEKMLYVLSKQDIKVKSIFDRNEGTRFGFNIVNFRAELVRSGDVILIASQAYGNEIKQDLCSKLDGCDVTFITL